jgi:DNA-binding GntR family transcriptional regulator
MVSVPSILKTPIQVRSMVDTVTERLEHAIMSGELPAGGKLSEQALADAFGVSRGPLREAIRQLEGRKLVQRIPYVGARVLALSQKDILDIFVVREALEGMAARLVAENATDDELRDLRAVLSPHVGSTCLDVDSYQRSPDLDFHYQIAMRSGNEKLIEFLCKDVYYLLRVFRYRSTQQPGRLTQGVGEHDAIINAIEARDPDGAEALMRVHLRNGRRSLMQAAAAGALAAPAEAPNAQSGTPAQESDL